MKKIGVRGETNTVYTRTREKGKGTLEKWVKNKLKGKKV